MASMFIQKAIKRPGALREKAGVKKGQNISESMFSRLRAKAKREGDTTTLRQIALAKTLKKLGRG